MNLRHSPWNNDDGVSEDMQPQFKNLAESLTPHVENPQEFQEIIDSILDNIKSLLAQGVHELIVQKCADNAVNALNRVNENIVSPDARAKAHLEVRQQISMLVSSLATDTMHQYVSVRNQVQHAMTEPVAGFNSESFSYTVANDDDSLDKAA